MGTLERMLGVGGSVSFTGAGPWVQGERQLEMKVDGNRRQANRCLCELMKWDFVLWNRAPYPRLVRGDQGFLVLSNLACEILGIVHFPWRRLMTFIIFSMEFLDQEFSATAVVDKTLKNFKWGK